MPAIASDVSRDVFRGTARSAVRTGSGSATSIRLSHPSAASPATQNMRPNMLRSHSCTSPVFTQRGSESGFSLSRYKISEISDGTLALENGGTVGSSLSSCSEMSRAT